MSILFLPIQSKSDFFGLAFVPIDNGHIFIFQGNALQEELAIGGTDGGHTGFRLLGQAPGAAVNVDGAGIGHSLQERFRGETVIIFNPPISSYLAALRGGHNEDSCGCSWSHQTRTIWPATNTFALNFHNINTDVQFHMTITLLNNFPGRNLANLGAGAAAVKGVYRDIAASGLT